MRRSFPLLAAAVLAALALELLALQWLKPLENRLLDSMVKTRAAALAPDPDIVLVDIDEKSLASMEKEAGRWPWPRVVHARLETLGEKMQPVLDTYAGQAQLAERFVSQIKRR